MKDLALIFTVFVIFGIGYLVMKKIDRLMEEFPCQRECEGREELIFFLAFREETSDRYPRKGDDNTQVILEEPVRIPLPRQPGAVTVTVSRARWKRSVHFQIPVR